MDDEHGADEGTVEGTVEGAVEQTTPLLRKLPPELRNTIYELVIIEKDPIDITTEQQPGITQACREIRSECLQMYCAANTFQCKAMSADSSDLDRLSSWMSRIGSINSHYLKSILLVIAGTGAFVKDPTGHGDPLASMVSHMRHSGCGNIRIQILVDSALLPAAEELHFLAGVLGSQAEVEASFSEWQAILEMTTTHYCQVLSIQCSCENIKDRISAKLKELNSSMEQVIAQARCSCYYWQRTCISIFDGADLDYQGGSGEARKFRTILSAVCKEHGSPQILFVTAAHSTGHGK